MEKCNFMHYADPELHTYEANLLMKIQIDPLIFTRRDFRKTQICSNFFSYLVSHIVSYSICSTVYLVVHSKVGD